MKMWSIHEIHLVETSFHFIHVNNDVEDLLWNFTDCYCCKSVWRLFDNKQHHRLQVKTHSSGVNGWYCVSAQAWKTARARARARAVNQSLPVDKHTDTSLNAGNPRWNNPIRIKSIKFEASKGSVIITASVFNTHTYTRDRLPSTRHCRPDRSELIISPKDRVKTPTLNTLN